MSLRASSIYVRKDERGVETASSDLVRTRERVSGEGNGDGELSNADSAAEKRR